MLSVIIASFNCKDKLKFTLDNLPSDVTETCEVIVVDGASTDGTRELIYDLEISWKKAGRDLKVIAEADTGIADA